MIKKPLPRPSDNPAIQRFLEHCHRRRYPAKSTIVHAGELSDTLYYIVDGSVSVQIEDEEHREIVLAYLNTGDFFGEMGLFDEEIKRRSAYIVSRTPCELAEISYSSFRRLAHEVPDILFTLSGQMAVRLRDTSQKVGHLAFMDATGRVARALLDLAKQPDALTHPDGMQIKITRQELGRIVGCSREMVGRVLKQLQEEGKITAAGKTIVVFSNR